jgi:hypothetical protein
MTTLLEYFFSNTSLEDIFLNLSSKSVGLIGTTQEEIGLNASTTLYPNGVIFCSDDCSSVEITVAYLSLSLCYLYSPAIQQS